MQNAGMHSFPFQNDGFVGDNFMDIIEPVAAYVPYMTCPGIRVITISYF